MGTMDNYLFAWVGSSDLDAMRTDGTNSLGAIAQALEWGSFQKTILLSNYPAAISESYRVWLQARWVGEVTLKLVHLDNPTDFGQIFQAASRFCKECDPGRTYQRVFHLSGGTGAMGAIWLLLAKTKYPAKLIQSSREFGVRIADVPFDIAVEYLPDLLRERDSWLMAQGSEPPPAAPEFDAILHQSRIMERLIQKARKVAPRNLPVLIEGESGTGKELLARAIHCGSPRRDSPFNAVNCGAIPPTLVESELFGHEKGSFTGADRRKIGHFEAAQGGTLFLDEVGELQPQAQVQLLRVLQEGEMVRVGSTTPIKVNVRIIAATNRVLMDEVAKGRFREDLFFRLAVAVLKVPPLRSRDGDVGLLIDHLLKKVNEEGTGDPGFHPKKIAPGARTVLLQHTWPGNVRELLNTLRRAATWSDGPTVTAQDMREALLPWMGPQNPNILERSLGDSFSLPEVIREVACHYLDRAMEESGGNKSAAAKLLGLSSYQTLGNWIRRYQEPKSLRS